jgi:enoyl-CoA hydratase/carnithine racemase
MSDKLLYEQDEHGIVLLTLNQPEARNPITDQDFIEAFCDACLRMQNDPTVRVAILTGAGSAFSSGGNVKRMAEAAEDRRTNPIGTRGYYRNGIQRLPLALEKLDVPVIAAVNGPAMGAGCDLTTMCDIRIAGESARFAESFVKLGLVAGDGGAWLLPRAVGLSRAFELAFTGDTIDAAEALRIGLVSQVVPDAELIPAARKLAMRIAANPPQAVRMTKKLIREGQHTRIDTLLELSAAFQAIVHTTADHREAANAFVEKRKPVFKGS